MCSKDGGVKLWLDWLKDRSRQDQVERDALWGEGRSSSSLDRRAGFVSFSSGPPEKG